MFFGQTMSNSLCLNSTDEYGIINNLNANKSPGHDELPILLIQESKYAICSYLSKTMNKCLFNGHYPDILKIAKVTPIFKRGQRNDPNDYRPIFVLSPFNKIAITQLYNHLLHEQDSGKTVCAIFLDLAKAFDTGLEDCH